MASGVNSNDKRPAFMGKELLNPIIQLSSSRYDNVSGRGPDVWRRSRVILKKSSFEC